MIAIAATLPTITAAVVIVNVSNLVLSVDANSVRMPITQFTEFDYTGLAVFNDKILMCSSEGLFEYSGGLDNDRSIEWFLEVATTDFDSLSQKRIRNVLGAGQFNNDLTLSVAVDDGAFVDYAVTTEHLLGHAAFKRHINREQKGSHFKVKLSGVATDFSLDALDATVMKLHNKPMGR